MKRSCICCIVSLLLQFGALTAVHGSRQACTRLCGQYMGFGGAANSLLGRIDIPSDINARFCYCERRAYRFGKIEPLPCVGGGCERPCCECRRNRMCCGEKLCRNEGVFPPTPPPPPPPPPPTPPPTDARRCYCDIDYGNGVQGQTEGVCIDEGCQEPCCECDKDNGWLCCGRSICERYHPPPPPPPSREPLFCACRPYRVPGIHAWHWEHCWDEDCEGCQCDCMSCSPGIDCHWMCNGEKICNEVFGERCNSLVPGRTYVYRPKPLD